MSRTQLVALNEAVTALLRLCKNGSTGTMYMYTDKGQGGVISINNGNIIDIFFRNHRGAAAVDNLKQVDRVKFFFKIGNRGTAVPDNALELNNEEIFRKLGVNSGISLTADLKTILVVEDSRMARNVLVQGLANKGYDIIEAKDGEEAIEQLASKTPDLVLLDLILPKKDGYQVLDSMKRHSTQKNIPVIVLTSRDTLFDKLRGKMSGSDEYMTKPININVLKVKVEQYLG